MLSLFTHRTILVFIIVIPEIAFFSEPDKLHKSEIKEDVFQWKMIKDFGQKYGVKYWVLHKRTTDDSSWKRWWHFLMKEKTLIGYFLSNLISPKNNNDSKRYFMKDLNDNIVFLLIAHSYANYFLQLFVRFLGLPFGISN